MWMFSRRELIAIEGGDPLRMISRREYTVFLQLSCCQFPTGKGLFLYLFFY